MNRLFDRMDRLSGPLLGALGLANALFALSFLAVLFVAMQSLPAHAGETCRGENVLDQMKRDDPASYRKLMDEAAATINGDTLLFRIDKPGLASSWLFGTMHLTDERVIDLPVKAKQAFEGADTVAIESTEILDPAKAQMALFSKPDLTMFTDGKALSDYLTAEQRDILKDGLAKRGMQLALVDRMKPWLLTAMVALPKCEMDRKQAGASFLDLKLAQDAQREGKDLKGLETIVEQFDAMASLPMEFHVRGLIDTIALGDKIDDVVETMIELYVQGRTGAVWPMLRAVTPEMESDEDLAAGYAAFEEKMVHVRNRTMLQRATPLLDKGGGVFIAVGALHLPGDKGLAKLLADAGYTVTPVYE
ncbi:TraB/GumN family protein [Oricola nitratireducens]|uniref:TraB/GumN family protein n=1 Tax=Oricola nitratireducens TaxID=2775868 RepID=UPI001FEFBDCA|nr:TraB/GumN family protein [Oricola nitratireducens]